MYRTSRARRFTLPFVFLLLLSLIPPLPVQAAETRAPAQQSPAALVASADDGFGLLSITLASDNVVAPGGTATLTLEATSHIDAPALTFDWLLPDGGELIGGAQENTSAIASGETRRSTRQVRFPSEGVFRVMASATINLDDIVRSAPAAVLYFTVSNSAPAVGDRDPAPVDPRTTRMEPIIVSAEEGRDIVSSTGVDPAMVSATDDPCFNITGRVTRIEKRPEITGLVLSTGIPVANAVIEMREEDTLFDDSYGTMVTGPDGRYNFSFCDDDGAFDDELEIYVRLRAELKDGSFTVVEVEDSSYIDEVYENDSNPIDSEGGNYTIDFALNDDWSAIFNIADAIWQAWKFWNESGGATGDDAYFSESAEVHWEVGYNDDTSKYVSFWSEITVASRTDTDMWDDGVMMHEWGHMADDYYGCDDNAGGKHNVDQLLDDPELAWGEAYPDYFQSAVRQSRGYKNADTYIEINAMGNVGFSVDLERFDSERSDDKLSDLHEFSIAAMLWDLNDSNQDGRLRPPAALSAPYDRVNYGHRMLQQVYTDPVFEANGDIFDDTCTTFVYLNSWRDLGLPTDGPTAEAITKNINRANPFNLPGAALAAADASQNVNANPAEAAAVFAAPSGAEDYQWWQRFTMVVDNSASMAGDKLNGVKAVIKEQSNDLATDPKGTQFKLYTFNNVTRPIAPVFTSYFTAPDVAQGVDTLNTIGAADPACQTYGLDALAQAALTMRGGQAWLYTDGDSYQPPTTAGMKQLLNNRGVRGSIVLLGGCGSLPTSQPGRSEAMKAYMGNAADASQPSGIVPYLLTALGSGGQFFYVNKDQLANAADVLRAQLGHTAGAGRWSDYVSDDFTYRWDRIDAVDWQWFPIDLSTEVGVMGQPINVTLGSPFPYWGTNRDVARVTQDGALTFDPCSGQLCPVFGTGSIYVLSSDLTWVDVSPPPRVAAEGESAESPQPEASAPVEPAAVDAECYFGTNYNQQVKLYRANFGIDEWVILTTVGEANYGPNDTPCRDFQVWLNLQDGRIRMLYNLVRASDSAASVIGLRQTYPVVVDPIDELILSNGDVTAAAPGTGFTFTPAPPQPTRTHTVAVDALMESIGFLQTGFSGNFEPMLVYDPAGNPVDCNDTARVICITMDNVPGDRSVQYVQSDVMGKTGVWSAVIDAGSSGSSTYSFTGMAASQIEAEGVFDHQRASVGTGPMLVKLGSAVDGNTLTGWLQTVNGARWGTEVTFYDDGLHGDGQPGDGQFGILDFLPPGRGVGYLWLRGAIDGEAFQRMDPAPINFQPFQIRSVNLPVLPNDGSPVNLYFEFTNYDSIQHCVTPTITVPEGWYGEWNLGTGYPCVPANGGIVYDFITVYPDWTASGAAAAGGANAAGATIDPSGARAVVSLSVEDNVNDAIADSAETQLERTRPAYAVSIDEEYLSGYLRPNNMDSVPIGVRVFDEQGASVADGTQVTLSTSLGTLGSTTLTTFLGRVQTTFTAGTQAGDALITATSNGKKDTATVPIRAAVANTITLAATPVNLGTGKTSELVATVSDRWGDPVAGAQVRIGVVGDGQLGSVTGGEVFTGTTNSLGQVATTFTRTGMGVATVPVRAELLKAAAAGGDNVAHQATLNLIMGGSRVIFLPLIDR